MPDEKSVRFWARREGTTDFMLQLDVLGMVSWKDEKTDGRRTMTWETLEDFANGASQKLVRESFGDDVLKKVCDQITPLIDRRQGFPASVSLIPIHECSLCAKLPQRESSNQQEIWKNDEKNWETASAGSSLPVEVNALHEITAIFQGRLGKGRLLRCPFCKTCYEHFSSHERDGRDHYYEEFFERLFPDQALQHIWDFGYRDDYTRFMEDYDFILLGLEKSASSDRFGAYCQAALEYRIKKPKPATVQALTPQPPPEKRLTMQAHFHRVTFSPTTPYLFEARVNGEHWTIQEGDDYIGFYYLLEVNGKACCSFYEWPDAWSHS